jgi:hypothetical protein
MKTVGAKLDLDTIRLLEEKAKKEGKNKNQILKELIVNYISNNTEGVQSVVATHQESKSDSYSGKSGNKESEPFIDMKQETQAKRTIVMRSDREKENKKAETDKIEEKLEKTEEEEKSYSVSEVAVIPKESNKLFAEEVEKPRKQKNTVVKSKPKKKSFWESFFEDDSWDIFDEDEFEDEDEDEEFLLAIGLLAIIFTGGLGGLGGLGVKNVGIGLM